MPRPLAGSPRPRAGLASFSTPTKGMVPWPIPGGLRSTSVCAHQCATHYRASLMLPDGAGTPCRPGYWLLVLALSGALLSGSIFLGRLGLALSGALLSSSLFLGRLGLALSVSPL